MRLLMRAGDGPVSRFARAAAGLALRGHRVHWEGPRPDGLPDTVPAASDWRAWAALRVDAVLGDGPSAARLALAGWFARAHVLVMPLRAAEARRWGAVERGCWHSLYGAALIESAEAAEFDRQDTGIALERLGLWPEHAASTVVDVTHPDTEILERALERALARQRGHAPRPALFVDRDGTLVREVGYLSDPAELELLPGVVEGLRAARAAGWPVIVISNQSGVGRGLFTLARVHQAMARLREMLREHAVELDAIYFCPHRPEEGCPCRKPRPGLLVRASEDQLAWLGGSVMVGDKRIDAETGRNAGAAGVLVRTGYGREEEVTTGEMTPDAVCDDLPSAVRWMLERAAGGD